VFVSGPERAVRLMVAFDAPSLTDTALGEGWEVDYGSIFCPFRMRWECDARSPIPSLHNRIALTRYKPGN